MLVLANDEEQAEEIGKEEWHEEISQAGLEPNHFDAQEVTARRQVAFYGDDNLKSITPYGPEGEDSPQMTIVEWLDAKGIT